MALAYNDPIQVLDVTNSGTIINEGTDDETFMKIGVRVHLSNGTSVVWNTQMCKEIDDLGNPTGRKVVRDTFKYHNEDAGGTLTRKAASMTRSAFQRLHPNFANAVISSVEGFVVSQFLKEKSSKPIQTSTAIEILHIKYAEQIAKREAKKMETAAKRTNNKH